MKQKIFTNASYEYMNEVMDLKELAKFYNKDASKILYGYDIILQLSLMHMVLLDGDISDIEMEFLSLIVKENDLMVELSKKLGKEISWNILKAIPNYNEFLDSIEHIFSDTVTAFIKELTSLDYKTSEDYLNRFKGNIYYICQAMCEVDGFDPSEKDAYKVLEKNLFKKLDEIKKELDEVKGIN